MFRSDVYFLGHCVAGQTGGFAVADSASEWWSSGADVLRPCELNAFERCRPSAGVRQGPRVPYL
eukprot:5215782-Pyramimonas_sp.AAC.1